MPITDFRQVGFALLLIIACSACKSDKQLHGKTQQPVFSKELKTILHKMAAENILMGSGVGFAGIRPEQWDRYEKLSRMAADDQLIALTNDTNAVVRCYAFQALVTRRHIDPLPVLIHHLSDTANVETLYGCLGGSQKVGDFYLRCMNNSHDSTYIRRLNKAQQKMVDSMLGY